MSLRQMSDGHVLTIQSAEGHMIELSVQEGLAVLSLSDEAVGGSGLQSAGARLGGGIVNSSRLEEGVFTTIVSGVENRYFSHFPYAHIGHRLCCWCWPHATELLTVSEWNYIGRAATSHLHPANILSSTSAAVWKNREWIWRGRKTELCRVYQWPSH